MSIGTGVCELYREGIKICQGHYTLHRSMDKGTQGIQTGTLEVNHVSTPVLSRMVRLAEQDGLFQLVLSNGRQVPVRLNLVPGSVDYDSGTARLEFEFVDWHGKFV